MFNIGNSQPTELLRFIEVMEQALGREAIKDFQPMQPGDVRPRPPKPRLLRIGCGSAFNAD